MPEEMLVRHCAPTLMGLKTGNMFSCRFETKEEEHRSLKEINCRLSEKGLRAIPLRHLNGSTLVYLYRPSRLRNDLINEQAVSILREMGYRKESVNLCLAELMKKLRENEEFPHEIGVFLGYPLEDVIGFIRWGGRGSKCSGIWKVYGDASLAQKLFAQYAKCRSVYRRLWQEGRSVRQLTVAV